MMEKAPLTEAVEKIASCLQERHRAVDGKANVTDALLEIAKGLNRIAAALEARNRNDHGR